MYAPSQGETTLQCNVVSRWLGAFTKWSLGLRCRFLYSNRHISDILRYIWDTASVITLSKHAINRNTADCIVRNIFSKVSWTLNDFPWWRQTKTFSRYWPFVRGIYRSPVNCPHEVQWHWALMFNLICAWTNGWANTRDAIMTSL